MLLYAGLLALTVGQAVPHLEKSLAHTLPLVALMHIEVQHTQRLNLDNGAICL